MKHPTSEEWADYIRGAAPQGESAEMNLHLETGCKKCKKLANMWSKVLKLASRESGYQPPQNAVRMAKSYLRTYPLEKKLPLATRVAQLVFDSLQQPQLVGVRATGTPPQHYVYRSGSLLVDVWMEPAEESAPVALTGQILDQSTPGKAVKDMEVKLRSGDAQLSTTTTNQFGEFHFEFKPQPGTGLQLTIGSDDRIAVLVPVRLIGMAQKGNG